MSGEEREGRVVASHGRDAVVADAGGRPIHCRLQRRGLSLVCGDRVRWTPATTEGGGGLISERLPRARQLARINARGQPEVVAANLTLLVAVVAPEPQPDFGLCDRYLAAAELAGLRALVVGNKCDLADADGALAAALDGYRSIGYPVTRSSKRTADGVDALAECLRGEVAVLVGQSGVGKSSLINRLAPGAAAAVDKLSPGSGAGRHTTTVSALFTLPSGGELIDSPGVRDFAPPLPALRQVADGFREIAAAAAGCRFRDCLHRDEPGCAVVRAADAGTVAARRLASYRALLERAERIARREPALRR